MNRWNLLGFIAAALMLLSALAHAFAGWPTVAEGLSGTGVATDVTAGLRVGWLWGSFCMAGFGLVTLAQSWQSRSGGGCNAATVAAVAGTYVAFGLWAFVDRDFNPHFLLFLLTGLLCCALLHPAARLPCGTNRG